MQLFIRLFILFGGIIFYAQCDTPEKPTLTVATIIDHPYTTLRESPTTLTGNERYEGYIVDLIDQIAKALDFKYELQIVEDGRYGSSDNGQWNGLIGEVQSGNAAIGAAATTITSERETAVDFTIPFMNLGITILYKRPPAGKAQPFANIEELAALKTTNFGCVRNGATHAFFAGSDYPTYRSTFERMEAAPNSSFVHTVSEGIERVKNEDYAFFMESSTLEYAIEHDCELQQVGGHFNSKGFGLAVQQGSPLREKLTMAILELQETGALAALKNKWWKRRNGEQCDD